MKRLRRCNFAWPTADMIVVRGKWKWMWLQCIKSVGRAIGCFAGGNGETEGGAIGGNNGYLSEC